GVQGSGRLLRAPRGGVRRGRRVGGGAGMSAVGLATRKRTPARPGRGTQRRGTSRPRGTQAPSAFAQWRTAVWASPTTSYYLVGGAVVLLLAIGLAMVPAASMVDSRNKT